MTIRWKNIVVVALSLALTGAAVVCSPLLRQSSHVSPALSSPVNRHVCPSKSDGEYYFPNGALNQADERSDTFIRGWYSSQLTAMAEPSLSCGLRPGQEYRFTWLRTFHHPVVVRVSQNQGRVSLTAIELNGAGGYEPGKVLRRKEATLSNAQFRDLQAALAGASFWSIPTTEENSGLDGAEWIVEASDNGRYHVVVRWSPNDGPIHALGMQFLKIANWQFKDVY